MQKLVKRQLEFRKLRMAQRSAQTKATNRLPLVGEGFEDRSRWLRLTATILLQTYVRVLRAADGTPAYRRPEYKTPDAAAFEERLTNLRQRFPEGVDEEVLATALTDCAGHGGYAVHEVQRRTGVEPVVVW
mmetsp:Transcript_5799/g.15064  ORF Transcript_5799/g.15064 Transcript_5799/m.15064 type:complete len:131 (-) Transcript_5799:175-567(-)